MRTCQICEKELGHQESKFHLYCRYKQLKDTLPIIRAYIRNCRRLNEPSKDILKDIKKYEVMEQELQSLEKRKDEMVKDAL